MNKKYLAVTTILIIIAVGMTAYFTIGNKQTDKVSTTTSESGKLCIDSGGVWFDKSKECNFAGIGRDESFKRRKCEEINGQYNLCDGGWDIHDSCNPVCILK